MSEAAPAASVTPIGLARKRLDTEGRSKLAGALRTIAGAIEGDLLAAGHPYAVAVAILTDDLPTAWVRGVVDRDDVAALQRTFEGIHASFWQAPKEGEALKAAEQVVQERHRRHLAVEAHHAAEQAADLAARPWSCEYCRRRFGTERGARQHEARCWRNPGSSRYGPNGKFRPLQVRDGIAHGYERKEVVARGGASEQEGALPGVHQRSEGEGGK